MTRASCDKQWWITSSKANTASNWSIYSSSRYLLYIRGSKLRIHCISGVCTQIQCTVTEWQITGLDQGNILITTVYAPLMWIQKFTLYRIYRKSCLIWSTTNVSWTMHSCKSGECNHTMWLTQSDLWFSQCCCCFRCVHSLWKSVNTTL